MHASALDRQRESSVSQLRCLALLGKAWQSDRLGAGLSFTQQQGLRGVDLLQD